VLGALGGAIFAIGSFALQFLDDEPVSVVPLAVMSTIAGVVWAFLVTKMAQRNIEKRGKPSS
jgi:predicted Na+-dependent transporter